MNAYYIRHFLASLAFPEEAISRVRHKFVLTLPAGDVEGWFFPLQPLLQDRDCKQHRAGDENHCSGKVEAGIIVAQSVVKSSCKELHKSEIGIDKPARLTIRVLWFLFLIDSICQIRS